ncbi:hypothetical protein MRBLMN1_003157 [Chitinophaga ginsengisegetis]|uniref:hypothetical protein n=1 Tax=Chitinophaga ginsengisegetis TaxID=393003 RepID=UPI00341348DE
MWKEILIKVLDGVEDIPSPFAKGAKLEHIFVTVDETTRIGFLWIWCPVTHRGIDVSRMKIPEDRNSVPAEEFGKLELPKISFEPIT